MGQELNKKLEEYLHLLDEGNDDTARKALYDAVTIASYMLSPFESDLYGLAQWEAQWRS